MKRFMVLGVSLLILTSLLLFGVQNRSRDIPPGVDPEMWVPVTDNFGIVLIEPWTRSKHRVDGTAMVKVDGTWHVLSLHLPLTMEPIDR